MTDNVLGAGKVRGAAKVLELIGRNHSCCADAVAYVLDLAGQGDLHTTEENAVQKFDLRRAAALALADVGSTIDFPPDEQIAGVDGILNHLKQRGHKHLGNAASVRKEIMSCDVKVPPKSPVEDDGE